ncbi:uncharacterized protein LOC112521320 [Cynara cardunculus var. scolymus]|uniref:F-box associated interaction domain-containing protein n=1 Tax=Cynara cardunculus var. scolymus TaxID=59895 RepID=A0A124SBB1_CYNCS|nr:uncharacterized protein LOC112521320 [Cynara cardunculus var. scolymus]KVH90085.1 F-box associated interaction domain-containing protein [Cynara cardunculus var. scolymus]
MEEDNQSLMELPKVNLEGVLARLPLQSLLVCCCVSKSLLNLIENDLDFAKEHFAISESQLMIHSPETTSFHLIDLDADATPGFGTRVEIKPNFNLPLHGFEVADSCNGLVLLESVDMVNGSHRCIVCNPVTGEYIMLPETKLLSRYATCALFYCPRTNQFKILRAFHQVFSLEGHDLGPGLDASLDSDPDLAVELDPSSDSDLDSDSASELNLFPDYDGNLDSGANTDDSSLSSDSDSDSDSSSIYSESDTMGELLVGGSDSWESLGNLPFSPLTIYSPCYLDKATHWLCVEESVQNLIVFFNFESHQFGEIPAPAHLGKTYINAYWLVALGGFLSIFDSFTTKEKFDIWVMKEYGSWTKDYVIDTTAWGAFHRDLFYKPAMCRRNGEVVMISEEGYILFYDLSKKNGRIIKHRRIDFPDRAVVHTPSIMSLRDAMRDSNMRVLNVASRFGRPELNPHSYLEFAGTFSE